MGCEFYHAAVFGPFCRTHNREKAECIAHERDAALARIDLQSDHVALIETLKGEVAKLKVTEAEYAKARKEWLAADEIRLKQVAAYQESNVPIRAERDRALKVVEAAREVDRQNCCQEYCATCVRLTNALREYDEVKK